MQHTIFILFDGSYSFLTVLLYSILGYFVGFFLRSTLTTKHKNRIIKLEDGMLKNHARMLELETKISALENENAELIKNPQRKTGLKAS